MTAPSYEPEHIKLPPAIFVPLPLLFAWLTYYGYTLGSDWILPAGIACFVGSLMLAKESLFQPAPKAPSPTAEDVEGKPDQAVFVNLRIESPRYFVLEAIEDEGTDYFFDLGEQGTVIFNDNWNESEWTPNSDFSFSSIEIPGRHNYAMRYSCVGRALEPTETLVRKEMNCHEYEILTMIPGSFEERLEEMRSLSE